MEATLATPDEGAPEATPDTPATEPVETPEAEAPADQSTAEPDRALGQAEYTRSQQAFSALKAELGLPKHASRDEVLAAVRDLRAEPEGDEDVDEEPEVNPAILEANERAFRAELRVSEAVYGADFTKEALELVNFTRTNDDPGELMTALAAFRDRWGAQAAPPAEEPAAAGNNAPPPPVGLSEGDAGPSARQPLSASQARRESGTTQAVRGIFESLGIGSRQNPPS